MADMFVEGIQGNVSWYFVFKVMIMSIAFVVILVQKSKLDFRKVQKYNKEIQYQKALKRSKKGNK